MPAANWLRDLRHDLHRLAEVSGDEVATASKLIEHLQRFNPDKLISEVGGGGVVAVFNGVEDGPKIGFRAELDALPIYELSDIPYRSLNDGVSHLCGHDGHMCMVLALAEELAMKRPQTGSVALIFQPAEETGQGAAALIADKKYQALGLDYVFSLHNVPGLGVGKIEIPVGNANCASRGIKIALEGQTSHAATPQDGVSPMPTVCRLMPELAQLSSSKGGVKSADFSLTTITHATLGKPTFGITPGYAEIWATLRSRTDTGMQALCAEVERLAQTAADDANLSLSLSYHEIFEACENQHSAVEILKNSLASSQIPFETTQHPQLWSEDFGALSGHEKNTKTAMFWLGSGVDQPQLHTPTYDFPDEILPAGTAAFLAVIRNLLG